MGSLASDLSNSKQIKMSAGECQSFACQHRYMRGRGKKCNHSEDSQQNQGNEKESESGGEVCADARTAEKAGAGRHCGR